MDNGKKRILELEIKLHINSKLFEKGLITAEMFDQAKILILKQNAAYI